MSKINISIKGDANILGNNNVQTFNKTTTSNVSKELIELISKISTNKAEQEVLESAVKVVQDEKQPTKTKTQAASKIATFLKTIGGEAGRAMLAKMMDSGIDWAENIATLAGML